MRTTLIGLVALCFAAASEARLGGAAPPLPTLRLYSNNITVSGLSAGAFFAVQQHVAFSSVYSGVGVLAGGPYYCAQGKMETALTTCMSPLPINPGGPDAKALVDRTRGFASQGLIDDLGNLSNSTVWVYSGKSDTVVKHAVVEKTVDFYQDLISTSGRVVSSFDIDSEHCWPTTDYGNKCRHLGSPFINNCAYDAAGDMLATLYPSLRPSGAKNDSNALEFDQTEFLTGHSVNENGYVYVPDRCRSHSCTLHVALHGCEQSLEDIQTQFVLDTQLVGYAESNDMVVLFPQIKHSFLNPYNPKGCFDWWGYAGDDYQLKSGLQMKFVMDMVKRLRGLN